MVSQHNVFMYLYSDTVQGCANAVFEFVGEHYIYFIIVTAGLLLIGV